MGIFSIILIAITEAMDCFAVSISTGLSKSKVKYSRALLQSFSFGFFQGGMTLLGYFLGAVAERWVSAIGTPIACGILSILGIRMIWEATHEKEDSDEENKGNLTLKKILLLSIATSIDAFAVGVSFAFMNVDLIFATAAIAIASFVIGHLGFEIGRHSAKHFKTKNPEIISGLILIGIGVKLLF